MKKIRYKSFPSDTIQCMEVLLKQTKTASETKRIQSILLGAKGVSSELISTVVGFTPVYIRKIWRRYRLEGKQYLLGERRGKNRSMAHMTIEEEKSFLDPFFQQAKGGGILIATDVYNAHKELLGKNIPLSTTYNLLHRHGWRKIAPRHSHPKGKEEKQKEFKTLSFPPGDNKGQS